MEGIFSKVYIYIFIENEIKANLGFVSFFLKTNHR